MQTRCKIAANLTREQMQTTCKIHQINTTDAKHTHDTCKIDANKMPSTCKLRIFMQNSCKTCIFLHITFCEFTKAFCGDFSLQKKLGMHVVKIFPSQILNSQNAFCKKSLQYFGIKKMHFVKFFPSQKNREFKKRICTNFPS